MKHTTYCPNPGEKVVTKPKTERKKGTVKPISISSTAKDWTEPMLHNVATKIVVQDEKYIPQYAPGSMAVTLLAKLDQTILLNHRGTATVPCGFHMTLPAGFKATINPTPERAARGVVVQQATAEDGETKVYVTNVGREIVKIENGEPIAHMTVEPAWTIQWER